MNAYSSLKPAWHLDKLAELRAGRDAVPLHVQLVLSDLCNQDCHFCAYRMEDGFSSKEFADAEGNRNPKRFIPSLKAKEILRDCAEVGVRAIQFTGGGEPTVHPDCSELIAYAQGLGLETALVTNAVRLPEREVVRKLAWIRVSLDAGKPETYERIRRSKAWPKVMQHMAEIGGTPGPVFGVGFVVTRENYGELVWAAEIARAAGAGNLRISAMFSERGALYYTGVEDAIAEQRRGAKALETDSFKVVDMFDNRVEDLKSAKPDYDFCGYQQFTLYIGGDQCVYTCCTNAYSPHGRIGDLKNQRLADWLKTYRRFDFDARSCHHCQFNDRNRIIQYLVRGEPQHVSFV